MVKVVHLRVNTAVLVLVIMCLSEEEVSVLANH